MRDALAATGRPIVYSVCEWGVNDPWTWAPEVGNLWRTTGDINDSYGRMLSIVHQNMALSQYAKPGAWNDPDMLEVGNGGMTDTEYRSEFSLWAEMAAPLIAGTDLREADAATMATYLNDEVIRVDQDRLGVQGQVISSDNGHDVFSKPLANGDRAVALFNETDKPATISTTTALAGLPSAPAYEVRDLWEHKNYETAGRIAAVIPPHGTVMYQVSAEQHPSATAPLTSFGLTSASAGVPEPGTPYPVRTTMSDYGKEAVTDVRVDVSAPDGWTVRPTSPASADRLGTNETLATDWSVTPPASADPGTYQLTATGTYTWRKKAEQRESTLTVRVPYPPVQAPYRTFTSTEGSFGQSGEQFQIVGDGTDTYGSSNEYSAIYLPGAESSGTVARVQVTGQQETSDWAKAGIMVRNDITASGTSPGYLIVAVTPGHGYVVQWDSDGNGTLDSNSAPPDQGTGTAKYPSWLKLTRSGSSYTGWYSTDGTTWTEIATVDVPGVAATQDVGMFMTSHNSGVQGEVDFRDFTTGQA